MNEQRPLISICLLCYNQERYIEETVKSALAQTYSPLEIIVSDDCSTDRTWEILQGIRKEYSGPHELVIHQNEYNQRIIRNLCIAMRLAHGELIVKADGDDILLPNRVEALVAHWLRANKEPFCLCSAYRKIDTEGKVVGEALVPFAGIDRRSIRDIVWGRGYFYLGTASAYRRDILEHFPQVDYETACDDSVFTVRSSMLGKLYVVPDILLLYRVGGGETTSHANYRKGVAKGIRYCDISQLQLLRDLKSAQNWLAADDYRQYKESLTSFHGHLEKMLMLYEGESLRERLVGYKEGCRGLSWRRHFSLYGLILNILLLPPCLADCCFRILMGIRRILYGH